MFIYCPYISIPLLADFGKATNDRHSPQNACYSPLGCQGACKRTRKIPAAVGRPLAALLLVC